MAKKRKRSGWQAILSFVIVLVFAFGAWRGGLLGGKGDQGSDAVRGTETVEGILEVHMIDVGQADCTLLKCAAGNVLIDAGDTATRDDVVSYLKNAGVSTLDYAIFTHPDADHIGGAAAVITNLKIKNVILPVLDEGDVPTTKVYTNMLAALEADESVNVLPAQAGSEYTIGELKMKILAPLSDNYVNINDYSVSARFDFGATSFLFTGDALETAERDMLEKYPVSELKADFFQAGHHGAKNANTADFVKAVSPSIVAVSCGKDNKYGHPTPEALAAYAAVGAAVYRTDELGTVIFVSDGKSITKQ